MRTLRAHLPTCLACLRGHVATCLSCLCAHVATCSCMLTCSRTNVHFLLSCSHVNMLYVLKCQRVLRVFRHKESSRIMISQIHPAFLMSLTKNGHFADMDPIKHTRSSFFAKIVKGLVLFYYFLKTLRPRCLTEM